mmetsp:Transcript_18436/g.47130  ORF Transcript_18436/g.47130 Transcript_18436/m.47130 type:complete len:153 (-) Transcript_18436:205-663(-)
METQGAWGDNVPLQALADRLGVEVALVTSFEECEDGGAVVLVSPRQMTDGAAPVGERGGRTLWLYIRFFYNISSIIPRIRALRATRIHSSNECPCLPALAPLPDCLPCLCAYLPRLLHRLPDSLFRDVGLLRSCKRRSSFFAEIHYQSIEPA